MDTTVESSQSLIVHQFERPEQWIEAVLTERRNGGELLLLDGFEGTISIVLADSKRRLRQLDLELTGPTNVPRPSAEGLGEVINAQQELNEQMPFLTWQPAAHVERQVRGKGVFTFPLGPVRADIAESMLFQLRVMGDEIVRLDLNHDLKKRHISRLAEGQPVGEATTVIERTTGVSCVAHALAYSMAVENALDWNLSTDTWEYRVVLAELERAHAHLWDLAQLAVSTGMPVPQMEYLHQRERLLRLNHARFGHRYLRGLVRPGQRNVPLAADGTPFGHLSSVVVEVYDAISRIEEDLLKTPSFLDRLHGAGTIPDASVDFVRPVGPVGRASALDRDVRTWRPYAIYDELELAVPQENSGDSMARFVMRAEELKQSLLLLRRLGGRLGNALTERAANEATPSVAAGGCALGVGMVEAPRGMLVYRVLVDAESMNLRHVGVATPSARNWYVVPPAIANGNIMQDFPIIDASFALSVAGWDR